MDFRTIPGDGRRHVVSTRGEGPEIVLLHGFPDTPHSFSELEAVLVGAGWRVSVPWMRGYHPDTLVPGRGYDPEALGRDALELLDALGVSRAVIVGHDWGALSAYVAAALAPERIPAIVTIGIPHPSVFPRSPQMLLLARHFLALKLPWASRMCRRDDFAYFDRLYRRWAPEWSGPERDETVRLAKQALSPPETLDAAISYYRDLPLGRTPVLERVPQVPGLVIGGTTEPGVLYQRTAELLAQPSRALIVQGAGHWPHREDPGTVTPAVLDFVGRLGA